MSFYTKLLRAKWICYKRDRSAVVFSSFRCEIKIRRKGVCRRAVLRHSTTCTVPASNVCQRALFIHRILRRQFCRSTVVIAVFSFCTPRNSYLSKFVNSKNFYSVPLHSVCILQMSKLVSIGNNSFFAYFNLPHSYFVYFHYARFPIRRFKSSDGFPKLP